MRTFRVQAVISNDGTLIIKKLPFKAGDKVEVIVRGNDLKNATPERYPLRGRPIRYVDPFESVAEADWDSLR